MSKKFEDLLAESLARYEALSPAEKAEHDEAQRQSWVRGEMAMGESSLIQKPTAKL